MRSIYSGHLTICRWKSRKRSGSASSPACLIHFQSNNWKVASIRLYSLIMKTYPIVLSDSTICHGKPVIAGTRIMVWQILELLESGENEIQIYKQFPSLPKGAVKASLHYAAERSKSERYVTFNDESSHQVFAWWKCPYQNQNIFRNEGVQRCLNSERDQKRPGCCLGKQRKKDADYARYWFCGRNVILISCCLWCHCFPHTSTSRRETLCLVR